jgi:hypothetical protein
VTNATGEVSASAKTPALNSALYHVDFIEIPFRIQRLAAMFRFTLREIFDQQGSCSRLEAQQRIVAMGATNMPP